MFSTLDWSIIVLYLVFAAATGFYFSRKAASSLSSYFVAGRSLPWWWLGTSMVATTFAADTPLAVTGIVALKGISGNWIWWNWGIILAIITVFFSKRWVKADVLTDVELTELRYEGNSAAALRLFKAIFSGLVLNLLILGWVFKAMTKIIEPFIHWQKILGEQPYAFISSVWPAIFTFGSIDNSLTVFCLLLLVVVYSTLGGIRAVILTDLVQFVLAVVGAIIFAWLAVDKIGGLPNLTAQIRTIYPDSHQSYLNFFPTTNGLMPLSFFFIYIGIQWFTKEFSDGSGYLAQRMNTARSPEDAQKGMLWFSIAHIAIRSWPWIIIGLVSLILFPIGNESLHYAFGSEIAKDRELAYPYLMRELLPSGILGLVFASLMAAFMSTVDTHLNWGSSYLINDVFKRFIFKGWSEKKYLRLSRVFIVVLAFSALIVASFLHSILGAWQIFFSLAAGVGLPQLLRWFWRRANAYTEIASICTSLVATIILTLKFPSLAAEYVMTITALSAALVSIIVTLLTPAVSENTWKAFEARTTIKLSHRTGIMQSLLIAILLYSLLFAIGSFLLLEILQGVLLLLLTILSLLLFRRVSKKL